MALTKQPLPIQFAGGVETKQDSKQVPTTQLLALENGVFTKRTSISKRNGYTSLGQTIDGAGSAYTTAVGLARRGDELLLFDGSHAFSYRESVDRWSDTGEVASVVAKHRAVARTGTSQTMPDHATNNGVTVVAWEDSRGGVRCSVLETTSQRSLLADALLDASGQAPRCIAVGEVLYVLWSRPDLGRIYVAVVNPVAPTTTPTGSVLVDDLLTTNPTYDACTMGGSVALADSGLIAWVSTTGWRIAYVAPGGILGSPVGGYPSGGSYTDSVEGGIALSFDKTGGTYIGVVFTTPAGLTKAYLINRASLAAGTSVTADSAGVCARAACEFDDTSLLWWATDLDGGADDLHVVRSGSVTTAAAVSTAARELRGHGLVSRAFVDDGNVYATIAHGVERFTYAAVVRLSGTSFGASGSVIVAHMLPVECTGLPTRAHVASVVADGRVSSVALGYRVVLADDDGNELFAEQGIRLASLDFDHPASYQAIEHGQGLYLAGACMLHYDGARWAEASFLAAPDYAAGTVTSGTSAVGGNIADGTYGYVLCYEAIDASGELHQGATSVPILVTVSGVGTSTVTIYAPTCRLTSRANVRIGVYRSPANQTGEPDAIPYYRVTSIDPSDTTGNNRYLANDATVDTLTFVDALADADLLQREPLYTNGGIRSNDPAPMAGDVFVGAKSRLFWTDQGDPQLVRYSKPRQTDLALEAVTSYTQPCDPFGGDITAIAPLDDVIIVGKQTALHVFGGPGPNIDGSQPDTYGFTPTVRLTSDAGIANQLALADIPDGLLFMSDKGIRLLDRSRQVVRVGEAVDGLKDQTYTRALLMPGRTQALMLTADGVALLYDYDRKQWSTFTNHTGYDAVVVGGTYHYLRTDGRVFREDTAGYRDGNSHITLRIETAWIKASGYLQGWQRIYHAFFLGSWQSSHDLVVRYRIDYDDAWSDPWVLDVDTNHVTDDFGAGAYGDGPYGGDDDTTTRYQRSLHLNTRCQAIQFRIEDREPTSTYGAAFELSELLLTGGVLGPAFRPGESRSN